MQHKQSYILAIDQSTSATKAMLFDNKGQLYGRKTIAHKQYYPRQGFVEHDPVEIFGNTVLAMTGVLKETQTDRDALAGISITNQRETIVVWDRHTGKPVYNAMVWQCQRGAAFCKELRENDYSGLIRQKTGLLIDPYFSAGKLRWLMDNVPGLHSKAENGNLLLGTIDSWLLWNLTGGRVHATDYSNACRTMLFNIHTLQWDKELISIFGLHENMFPEVRFSDEIFGYTSPEILPGPPLPVAGLLGDSHGALVGQNCFDWGTAKATYGTGSSIMMNIGKQPVEAPAGLVTSVGYGMDKQISYVFEGNIHCTGDTINWLKNDLQMINDASEAESLAISAGSNNGVYLVPAFVGLGAPYWDNGAKACLSGMSRDTAKSHIVRAAIESIAYQVKDLIMLMEDKGGAPLNMLRVDGGPTRNNFLMQFQADMLNCNVKRSEIEEISALGATFMAGLAIGLWKNTEEIKSLQKAGEIFYPAMGREENEKLYDGWQKAVERTLTIKIKQ